MVVVGGGNVAARKVRGLLEAGACVTVVAPAIEPALRAGPDAGGLTLVERPFAETDLDGATLAFAATDRDDVNATVVAAARARGIPVNDTTDSERSDFATALVLRAPLARGTARALR